MNKRCDRFAKPVGYDKFIFQMLTLHNAVSNSRPPGLPPLEDVCARSWWEQLTGVMLIIMIMTFPQNKSDSSLNCKDNLNCWMIWQINDLAWCAQASCGRHLSDPQTKTSIYIIWSKQFKIYGCLIIHSQAQQCMLLYRQPGCLRD